MNLDHFGMDTITLAGPLEAKLRAVRAAGFTQIMLSAQDIVGHPGGEAAAIAAVQKSGLRVTGFQVLRDFEGLSGHLHEYKLDIANKTNQLKDMMGLRGPYDVSNLCVLFGLDPSQGRKFVSSELIISFSIKFR